MNKHISYITCKAHESLKFGDPVIYVDIAETTVELAKQVANMPVDHTSIDTWSERLAKGVD